MEEIKVSVIVPSYKRERKMFSRAIGSLLSQSYDNIEIIVVDDNAGDELVEFRESLQTFIKEIDSDKIIYLQNQENLGGSLSRNKGIENSSGEFITFLDDDDRYLKHKIKNQVEFMLKEELDMTFTNLIICNGEDKVIDYREYSKIKQYDNDYLMRYHLTRQITGTNTFMYAREALLKIGGFVKVPIGQEYYLMYNTIKSGINIGYCDTKDALLYRAGQDCISNGPNKVKGQIALYKFKKNNFYLLKFSERCFVRFRHNVVMAVSYKRNKQWFKSIGHVFGAFLSSPIHALKEFFNFFSLRKTIKMEINE